MTENPINLELMNLLTYSVNLNEFKDFHLIGSLSCLSINLVFLICLSFPIEFGGIYPLCLATSPFVFGFKEEVKLLNKN